MRKNITVTCLLTAATGIIIGGFDWLLGDYSLRVGIAHTLTMMLVVFLWTVGVLWFHPSSKQPS